MRSRAGGYHVSMAFWDVIKEWFGLIGQRTERPEDDQLDLETPRRPPLTPTIRVPERPHDTPTTRPLEGSGTTAGTPIYKSPKDTPSTQRIHNPIHFRS